MLLLACAWQDGVVRVYDAITGDVAAALEGAARVRVPDVPSPHPTVTGVLLDWLLCAIKPASLCHA